MILYLNEENEVYKGYGAGLQVKMERSNDYSWQ